jgi:glucosylceramidase
LMNQTDQKIDYNLWVAGDAAPVTSLPHSIETLVF